MLKYPLKLNNLQVSLQSLCQIFSFRQIYLTQYLRERFTEKETVDKVKKFLQKLEDISTEIHQRNKPLDIKYEWLLPENIPQSITI